MIKLALTVGFVMGLIAAGAASIIARQSNTLGPYAAQDAQVGRLAIGVNPSGDNTIIKVDAEGRVYCSPEK